MLGIWERADICPLYLSFHIFRAPALSEDGNQRMYASSFSGLNDSVLRSESNDRIHSRDLGAALGDSHIIRIPPYSEHKWRIFSSISLFVRWAFAIISPRRLSKAPSFLNSINACLLVLYLWRIACHSCQNEEVSTHFSIKTFSATILAKRSDERSKKESILSY